jgi:hypothetical protein
MGAKEIKTIVGIKYLKYGALKCTIFTKPMHFLHVELNNLPWK